MKYRDSVMQKRPQQFSLNNAAITIFPKVNWTLLVYKAA